MNRAPRVVATGREAFGKGGSEVMALSEKKSYSVGRKWVYILNRRKAKKEIPDKTYKINIPEEEFTKIQSVNDAVGVTCWQSSRGHLWSPPIPTMTWKFT